LIFLRHKEYAFPKPASQGGFFNARGKAAHIHRLKCGIDIGFVGFANQPSG